MKNLKKFSVLSCLSLVAVTLAFAFASCSKDDHKCPDLKFSPDKVDVLIGKPVTVTVSGGTAPYTVLSCDDKMATVKIDKNILTITGVNPGKAMIAVTDKNKITGTLSITIKGSATGDLDISKPGAIVAATVNEGRECVVTVKGGTPPYTPESKDPKTATATAKDDKVTITGVKAGTTTITVSGTDKKNTGTITVTVNEVKTIGKLDAKNDAVTATVNVGSESIVSVEGGTAPYTAVSKDAKIAKVIDVKDGKVAIEGVKAGKTTITVTGTDKKNIGTITVTVK